MNSILIIFQFESNTGYALEPLELTFFQMALKILNGDQSKVHFAYPSMKSGVPRILPKDFTNYLTFDQFNSSHIETAENYITKNKIDTIFGFDLPVKRIFYKNLRKSGISKIISYWGAPMSSLNNPIKLFFKKLDVLFSIYGPDHYIFESHGMAKTAYLGRGISKRNTSVVPLGIDNKKFSPILEHQNYVYETLNLSNSKKVFFYSGHMEPRKGVATIMEAANILSSTRQQDDWHICLFGNKPGEEKNYVEMLTDASLKNTTFGGYRHDLEKILRGCYAGIIASTGWDSFPRSSLEIQSSGLPLLASNLPGLNESLADHETGLLFPVGSGVELAKCMQTLLDDTNLRNQLSTNAIKRIESKFTLNVQLDNLVKTMLSISAKG